jgi:hypothetical protein
VISSSPFKCRWRGLGKYFHKFDAVILIVLVGGLVVFVWKHWQNRIRTA